jgi:hypothetical protein
MSYKAISIVFMVLFIISYAIFCTIHMRTKKTDKKTRIKKIIALAVGSICLVVSIVFLNLNRYTDQSIQKEAEYRYRLEKQIEEKSDLTSRELKREYKIMQEVKRLKENDAIQNKKDTTRLEIPKEN